MLTEITSRLLLFTVEISDRLAPLMARVVSGTSGVGAAASFEFGADLMVGAFLIFILFVLGITLGKSKLVIGIVSIYISSFLERLFPYHNELSGLLGQTEDYWIRIGLLVFFYLIVFLLLNRSMARSRLTLREISFFAIIPLSILQAGFIISVILTLLPPSIVDSLSPYIIQYFGTPRAQFAWALLPLISFMFLGRKRKSEE